MSAWWALVVGWLLGAAGGDWLLTVSGWLLVVCG